MTAPHELLILVPARGGSQRLPGKNLKRLCGKSLIAHAAAAVAGSGLAAPVLLSTDDDAIAEEGLHLSMLVPFRRPAALSHATAPTIGAVLHALDWYRTEYGQDPKAVMVLQPTSPLRGGRCLTAAVDMLARRSDADSVIAMTALHLPAHKLFYADQAGAATAVADDDRRPLYVPNGALYLARTARLRSEATLYAGRILPLVLDRVRAVDIDTEADWQLAEALIQAGLPPEPTSFSAMPSAKDAA